MTLDQFLDCINNSSSNDLAAECLHRNHVYAFPDEAKYKSYIDQIKLDYPKAEKISIMGSGNWGYSLNPKKKFSLFHVSSDIDVAIICPDSFHKTWEELRTYHRKNFYFLDTNARDSLKRNGENVYSGFISPKWIPDRKSKLRFSYELNTNKFSNADVGYRSVNMFYFRNIEEAIDYYVRGFNNAKKKA